MRAPFVVRLRALVNRRAADGELDEELRYHLERETERNIANGMSPLNARDAARRTMGNLSVAADHARDAWRWQLLEELWQDATYAVRTCRRAPSFVFTVVGTIGLGLGLLVIAFTLFDAYVLRPAAVRDPDSLYDFSWHSRDGQSRTFSWPQYRALGSPADFANPFAYVNLIGRMRGHPALGQLVSGNYFQCLGVPAALGRVLQPEDADVPGGSPVVVLSHDTWVSQFGGDSAALGSTVALNGVNLRVVGVMPATFAGLESVPEQFWAPITMIGALNPSRDLFGAKPAAPLRIVGRIPAGVSVDRARAQLLAWLVSATSNEQPMRRAHDVVLVTRRTSIPLTPETMAAFSPLALAFVLVMLIACANIANVMLARGIARQREIGVRLALGAARGRLVRQLLTESALLSVPAAIVGFLVSRGGVWLGVYVMFAATPPAYRPYIRIMPLVPDTRIVIFTMLSGVVAAVLFGLAPALQATRPSVVRATRGDFDSSLRPSKLRSVLVVGQIASSALLLISAAVLLHAARDTTAVSPGIRTRNVVQLQFVDRGRSEAVRALRASPGVTMVAGSERSPLDGLFRDIDVGPAGMPVSRAKFNIVSPDYFATLDLRVIRGRTFTDDEARARAPVAVVSEAMSRALWPAGDAIGQRLVMPSGSATPPGLTPYRDATVVGVVANAVPGFIVGRATTPVVYYPEPVDAAGASVIARTVGDAEASRVAIERVLDSNDSVAVQEVHTLEAALAVQVYPFKISYWIASVIGGVALLLTITGVYGVLSYMVAQRTREFGVRLALGATPAGVIGLALRQLARLGVVGLASGAVLALLASTALASVLDLIDTYSLSGYVIGLGVVFASCLCAAYVPARRAASVNPVEALRS